MVYGLLAVDLWVKDLVIEKLEGSDPWINRGIGIWKVSTITAKRYSGYDFKVEKNDQIHILLV